MDHAAKPAQKTPAIILLMTMTLLGVFPLDVILPSFPALAERFQTSSADIALSVSLFAIGLSFSLLVVGPLSDSLGRKKLLLAGMSVAIAGAAGCIMASEYPWFLFFRVIQAIGCGCFVLSQALVQDLFVGKEQERLRIALVTASGIFISFSPLLGTWLQEQLGWQGSFEVFIAIGLLVILKACLLLENTSGTASSRHRNILAAYWLVCSEPRFVGYWLISALAFACHFSFIVISPIIFMEQLQLSPYQYALALLMYGAAYVLGGFAAGVMNRHMQASTQIITGLLLIALSGLLMLFLLQSSMSAITVLLPMIVCTAGTTITRPVATSRAMGLFPQNAGTSASAGNMIIFTCGGLISAFINLSASNLIMALGLCFLVLSASALTLNSLVNRHNQRACA
ncbi:MULTISPECIES: MFS transporter [Pseudomonas]|uniref:MFS transporter n=1 Tax=Pseudomonas sessilinigenes TaxID=658629 RepID=A0ABX8MQ63_9PSED|nr:MULTISPECIES: MFS transporter [Pseudomonas]AZC25459.1 Multidrug resistance transporter, Bcr/CflA family [Pseudomonas sessilinigenes]QIH11511.1 multidrug effflux MFS transporter [Pseudomonas sp. BIOMIG1BAC]QXH40483.1 MFS transporter [Pseudomonas sessilinigenes]UMZ11743.1 MFS transporter [Pseudomonas sp. MPFS]